MQLDWLRRLLFNPESLQRGGILGWLLKPTRFLYLVCREFRRDLCLERAASLTFATILSLIPLSVLFFSFADIIGEGTVIQGYVKSKIFPLVAPEFKQDLEKWLEVMSERIGVFKLDSLVAFGALVTLVVAALGVILTAERNFNRIWKTTVSRRYLQKFAVFWVILTISPFVLIASTQIGGYLVPEDSFMEELTRSFAFLGWIYDFLLPVALGLVGFSVLYLFLPCTKVQLSAALLGGLVAAVAWEASKRGFAHYVTRTQSLYGQLGIVPLFLVWIYVNWIIILFGCVLSYVHQNLRLFDALGRRMYRTRAVPPAFLGMYVMERVARAFAVGDVIPTRESIAEELGVRAERVEEAAACLLSGGLLAETTEPSGGYALRRAPDTISLREIVALLPQEDYPDELLKLMKTRRVGEGCEDIARGSLVVFQEARNAYLKAFADLRLADVLERSSPAPSAEAAEGSPVRPAGLEAPPT